MAWVRQLPSGLWAATVRLPTGRRRTTTHELKSVVAGWAADLESDIRRGDWLDPRAGEVSVADWWQRCRDSRALERASRKRDESQWRCHVEPYWGQTMVGAILRPDVSAWVVDMQRRGVGAATIEGSLGVLRALLEQAVDARLVRLNAARGVRAPRRSAHLDRVLAGDEDQALLDALDRAAPGVCPEQGCGHTRVGADGLVLKHQRQRRPCPGSGLPAAARTDARLLAELILYCGLRWEEACALDREHVQLRHGLLDIGPVLERDGTIRPYPKSNAGARQVPVDDALWPRLRKLAMATAPGGLLVTSPAGGTLDYSRWYARVWRPALTGQRGRAGSQGHAARDPVAGAGLADPQPTPHDLRHTYGTRLAESGVVPHEIMSLMGHSSLAAVQRYLHPGAGRFARARDAIAQVRQRLV